MSVGLLLPRTAQPRRTAARVEHYVARGGGAAVFSVAAGDEFSVTDVQGGQRAELTVLGARGGHDFGALEIGPAPKPGSLASLSGMEAEEAAAVAVALRRGGVVPGEALAAWYFGEGSEPGATIAFIAQRAATCVVAAPGGPMRIDEQTPPGAIVVKLRRAGDIPGLEDPAPPAPLADPRLDFRVDRASALGYEVRAGEFIQVIDLAGRQCSDFQAFHLADLERGVERSIDSTVTRTLTGTPLPVPGLFSKFFDQQMRPLVEIVRDTVGRHDAFQLACTAKYYEELGYPGHRNCSDNFSEAGRPFGIEGRKGWPAINFFNNAAYGPDGVMAIDEPWSRPGDYVLMRALTDLVCLSSACPDDIGPSNGWDLTDIHVRVYTPEKLFSKGIAYRMTPDSAPQMTRESAFHPRTSALTSTFAPYRGYWQPTAFERHGPAEEYHACRERAAIMDLSALRKFEIVGPDAEALMQRTLTRDVARMATGHVVYGAMCNPTGGILDDGTLFRLGETNFRWSCNDDYCGAWLREKAAEYSLDARVRESTDHIHNLAVQGPKSRDILEEIVWTPPAHPTVRDLARFRFVVGRLFGSDGAPVMVSRTGYTGGLGYEVWCHPDDALGVWDAIWKAGAPHGLMPAGAAAMDILRIEAGLVFAGQEFDDQTDPFEAGIGFTVALKAKAETDFVGKVALIRRKAAQSRVLVGLELEGSEAARHGEGVFDGRSRVGTVTSGTRSPILRKSIALARLAIEYSVPGTAVEVGKLDGHRKRISATVAPLPFIKIEQV